MSTTYEIRKQTQTSQITDTGLCRLCLLLSSNHGNERDVNDSKILVADTELELSQSLDERSRLDVSDSTSELLTVSL